MHSNQSRKTGGPTWRRAEDGDSLSGGGWIISVDRWIAGKEVLCHKSSGLAVELRHSDDLRQLGKDLQYFPCLVLALPQFNHGVAYSLATALRRQHGYAGELIAAGDVRRDQMTMLQRVGIDFFLAEGSTQARPLRELQDGFAHHYQPQGNPAWIGSLRYPDLDA